MAEPVHPPWFNPERPSQEDGVLPYVLERNARVCADDVAFRFDTGDVWTHAETLEKTRQTAAFLQSHGVSRGDLVVVWLPSGPDIIRCWFALNYLGAVFAPLNLDYRGSLLQHAISETRASLMIVHPGLVDRLEFIDDSLLQKVLVVGEPGNAPELSAELVSCTLDFDEQITEPADVNLWDPQMVIFTSGTTGPSKGVLCPYLHQYRVGECCYGYMGSDDCIMIDLPMFHVGGVSSVMGAVCKQAVVALYSGFSTADFWARIRENNASSVSGIIGAMAAFLAKAPKQDDDADNPLKMVTLMLNEQVIEVAKRFGFSYVSGFNMSELAVPLLTEVDCREVGSCGVPRTGCQARVVDAHDIECEPGVVGELVVRYDQPWETCIEYLNQPAATAEAWRNGWFHTGDLVRREADGNFYFVDRLKDAVRRRGENVSSIEVESEILGFEAVNEVAVVGVPSEHGEEELLAAVASGGPEIDPRALVEYLIPRMPHYMVPRYIRVMDALPKTPTNKIQKYTIREEGVTKDTWDREAAGMKLKRTRLS
ncbi:MAG: AMP-binding protein [Gammaproteobacteria bacterium]|nr:AMP-binding protein [Gammaproteobacteria bacterium]